MDRRKFITSGTSACAGFAVYGSRAYAASERSAEPYTAAPGGNKILKLNHNANPLGMPPGARAAVLEALEEVRHYPRARRGQLRARLAELHGLNDDQVILGAGSTELIRCAIQAHATAVVGSQNPTPGCAGTE